MGRDQNEWVHPGKDTTEPSVARLCWQLRRFCLLRFSNEVARPHFATLVSGEPFDVDRALREPPVRA